MMKRTILLPFALLPSTWLFAESVPGRQICKPEEVVIVSAPLFVQEGSAEWVHSWLFMANQDGRPDFNRVLDESYFHVQAPILEEGEMSREMAIGTLHASCGSGVGRKVLTYGVYILAARVVSIQKNLGPDEEFILVAQDEQLMPRLRLRLYAGGSLLDERQVLPFYGTSLRATISEVFELNSPLVESYLVEVVSPVEYRTRIFIPREFQLSRGVY